MNIILTDVEARVIQWSLKRALRYEDTSMTRCAVIRDIIDMLDREGVRDRNGAGISVYDTDSELGVGREDKLAGISVHDTDSELEVMHTFKPGDFARVLEGAFYVAPGTGLPEDSHFVTGTIVRVRSSPDSDNDVWVAFGSSQGFVNVVKLSSVESPYMTDASAEAQPEPEPEPPTFKPGDYAKVLPGAFYMAGKRSLNSPLAEGTIVRVVTPPDASNDVWVRPVPYALSNPVNVTMLIPIDASEMSDQE